MADNIFTNLFGSLRRAVGRDPAPPPAAPTHDAAPQPAHVDAPPPPPPPDMAPDDAGPIGVGDALAVQQGIQPAPLSVPHVDPTDDGPIGVGDAQAVGIQPVLPSVPHVDPAGDAAPGTGDALATSAQSIAQHIVDDVVDDVVVNLGTSQANTGPNIQIMTGDPIPPPPAPEFPPEDVTITTGDAIPSTPGGFGSGASPSPPPVPDGHDDPGFGSGADIPTPHVGGTDFGIPLPPEVQPVVDPAEVAPSASAPMPTHHDVYDDDGVGTDPGGMTDHSVSDGVDGAADDI